MPYADLGEARLFYTDDGTGETTLLLVHGLGADSHEWVHHIPALRERHRVIAVDLRGHGYSSAPPSGNEPRAMAADLLKLCDALGVARCVPVGHSMGGHVVVHLAAERPELVPALVAVDAGYGFAGAVAAAFPGMIAAMRADVHEASLRNDEWTATPATPAWIREWHRRRILATPPHVLLQAFEGMFGGEDALGLRHNAGPHLARLACPVLSFRFDREHAAWEAGVFKDPRSRVVLWEGSGHRLHEERPAEFVLVLTEWLRSLQ
ncbi:pimeloyl-ACP methyl ester carboxylesterase [Thermocatellispora tengchongensis]|uniref:Pimeloyl-ACP methyl ester carboxylesterase n=1 Tax=Thermocatellispora tengchongensis TaxID=1073253 RepID=A0A840P7U5_9ACTN|nr:alpha/beta hydrolase [Thermocatellispora tengchongensis]MBB5133287.1 pimeloyl-ACP methyl ester carboxylesterase [Thermocatellispora tengchongensis]